MSCCATPSIPPAAGSERGWHGSAVAAGEYDALLVEVHEGELPKFGTPFGGLLEALGDAGYRLMHWQEAGRFAAGAVSGQVSYLLALSPSIDAGAMELRQ